MKELSQEYRKQVADSAIAIRSTGYEYYCKAIFKNTSIKLPYFFTTIIVDQTDNSIYMIEPFKQSSIDIIRSKENIHTKLDIVDSEDLDIVELYPESNITGIIYYSDRLSSSKVINTVNFITTTVYRDYLPDEAFDGLFGIMGTLEEFYGDNYDIRYREGSTAYKVTIRYPEITIKNSRGRSHKIEKLYVSFRINYNKDLEVFTIYTGLSGFRENVSESEYNSGYYHSHLSGQKGGFCMGSSQLGNLLHLELCNNITESSFIQFLILLDAYVEWESLEGGPYRRIEGLLGVNNYIDNQSTYYSTTIEEELFGSIVENNILLPISYEDRSFGNNTILIPYIKANNIQGVIADFLSKEYICYFIDGVYTNSLDIKEEYNLIRRGDYSIIYKDKVVQSVVLAKNPVTKDNINRVIKVAKPAISMGIAEKLTYEIQDIWKKQK